VPQPPSRYPGSHIISACVLTVQQFGEAYRPCQLSRFVYGFPRGKNQNDYLFAQSLNYRLFPLLQQHSANKPILVFVSTRKGKFCYAHFTLNSISMRTIGVLSTAEQLMADYNKAIENKQALPWSLPKRLFTLLCNEYKVIRFLELKKRFKASNLKVRYVTLYQAIAC